MIDNPGFIPFSRASLMMDVVSAGMLLILPLLGFSIRLVRKHKKYRLHKQIQLVTGMSLLFIVTAFELHIRLHGWQDRAMLSPYFDSFLFPLLYFHLFFAVFAVILWGAVLFRALKFFSSPPEPSAYSREHRRLARAAVLFMAGTAFSGWSFYYVAFVAA